MSENDEFFNRIQWEIRAAFERGYRAANPETKTKDWKDAWLKSESRAFLVRNGLITGGEGYK